MLRAVLILFYIVIVAAYTTAYLADPSRLTLLLLLIAEGITLVLVLVARVASTRDASLLTMVATVIAVTPAFFMSPSETTRVISEAFGVMLQLTGLALQLAAKLALGRRFGALPAQRGSIGIWGPYRFVRHPMYLGYLISHIGFLAANFSMRNLAVLIVVYACQVYRILREEKLLSRDPDYVSYIERVRKRVIPGVW